MRVMCERVLCVAYVSGSCDIKRVVSQNWCRAGCLAGKVFWFYFCIKWDFKGDYSIYKGESVFSGDWHKICIWLI